MAACHFTQRFLDGLVSMCIKDSDHSVNTAMLQQFTDAEIVLIDLLEWQKLSIRTVVPLKNLLSLIM